ncbi:MAG: hypothetical protein ACEQSD_04105 [Flavobacteriales bacterium]
MTQKTGTGLASVDQASQTISLLTTTTGFIDIYALTVEGEPDWILPQNLVMDTVSVPAQSTSVEWQGQQIPLKSLLGKKPSMTEAIAVLLEADNDAARIGVLTAVQPKTMRVRISNLRDANDSSVLLNAYQKVLLEDQMYQVPDLDRITAVLLQKKK